MNKIARFKKVSYQQFKKDWLNTHRGFDPNTNDTDKYIHLIYNKVEIPTRATYGSAGYDFVSPIDFILNPNETIKIPTGIRVQIRQGWFLTIVPRSSLGFKYRLQLDNTCGIVDSDYYHAQNEGHIFIKLTNDNRQNKGLNIKAGDHIVQGIFLPFGITIDDNKTTKQVRTGGFGSTNKTKSFNI